jgi:hypothetical protein
LPVSVRGISSELLRTPTLHDFMGVAGYPAAVLIRGAGALFGPGKLERLGK